VARKSTGISWHFLLSAGLAFIACVLFLVFFGDKFFPDLIKPSKPDKPTEKPPAAVVTSPIEPTPAPAHIKEGEAFDAEIYFLSPDGVNLKAEKRPLKKGSVEEQITEAVAILIKGSKTGLDSTIPEGTKLLSVKIKNDVAYVDLSKEVVENHPGGSAAELQTIYSIVNTVALNSRIKRVKLLVGGKEMDTLAGHIIISAPLAANKKLTIER